MLAGGLGTGARYGLTLLVESWPVARDFPLGTLLINVSGALLLSFVATWVLTNHANPDARLILGTGFCGGYTTFSTFALESDALMAQGRWTAASLYIGGNLVLGFGAVLLGRVLALRYLATGSGA